MTHADITTVHVHKAITGDRESIEWIVERFAGLLRSHARWRIGRGLGALALEDDLVQEVWLRVLPKLTHLEARNDRITPVLVRFLGNTLINVCFEIQKRALRLAAGALPEASELPADPARESLADIAAKERGDVVLRALDALDSDDRSILVMRILEGTPNTLVAKTLGIDPSSTTRRYQKALRRLRERLPDSLFADL